MDPLHDIRIVLLYPVPSTPGAVPFHVHICVQGWQTITESIVQNARTSRFHYIRKNIQGYSRVETPPNPSTKKGMLAYTECKIRVTSRRGCATPSRATTAGFVPHMPPSPFPIAWSLPSSSQYTKHPLDALLPLRHHHHRRRRHRLR